MKFGTTYTEARVSLSLDLIKHILANESHLAAKTPTSLLNDRPWRCISTFRGRKWCGIGTLNTGRILFYTGFESSDDMYPIQTKSGAFSSPLDLPAISIWLWDGLPALWQTTLISEGISGKGSSPAVVSRRPRSFMTGSLKILGQSLLVKRQCFFVNLEIIIQSFYLRATLNSSRNTNDRQSRKSQTSSDDIQIIDVSETEAVVELSDREEPEAAD